MLTSVCTEKRHRFVIIATARNDKATAISLLLSFFLSFFPRFVSLKSRRDRPAVDPDFAISATEKRAFVLRRVAPAELLSPRYTGCSASASRRGATEWTTSIGLSRSSASRDTFTFPLATIRGRFVSLLSRKARQFDRSSDADRTRSRAIKSERRTTRAPSVRFA